MYMSATAAILPEHITSSSSPHFIIFVVKCIAVDFVVVVRNHPTGPVSY